MLTLNFFKTFTTELTDFLKEIQNLFGDIFSSIHKFLNRFIPDEIILGLGIVLLAMLAIVIFRAVINRR